MALDFKLPKLSAIEAGAAAAELGPATTQPIMASTPQRNYGPPDALSAGRSAAPGQCR
jgi:hypothetical protein